MGGQGGFFEFLKLLGDIAFIVFQGLPSDVIGGQAVLAGLSSGNFNIVTRNLVVAYLKGVDPGATSFASTVVCFTRQSSLQMKSAIIFNTNT